MRVARINKLCSVCQKSFSIYPSSERRGEGLFCGQVCFHASRSRPESVRFWEKVNKDGPIPAHCPELGPCWVWTGASKQLPWNYGTLGGPKAGAAPKLAHRVSWELHCGSIPAGQLVLHKCDHPPCVNPAHLFLGTPGDNMTDKVKKGRGNLPLDHSQGEKNPAAKLTAERVLAIRARYAAGGITQEQIATEEKVSKALIALILTKNPKWRVWQHLD
jgi:hypothetical protein